MILDDILLIVGDLHYPGFEFRVGTRGGEYYVQVAFTASCSVTGAASGWSGRKWFVSKFSTPDEVIHTAFKAVLTALEHEARELFKWRGEAVFGPHIAVEELHKVARVTRKRLHPET